MNKEIKEILDKCTPFLFGDEVDKLTNYITNLQKRIDKAIKEIEYFELKANHLDDDIYLDEELSNRLLNILRGVDNEL